MTKEELREKRGTKTQEEMARDLKTPLSTYRKWEQGARKVPGWVDLRFSPSSIVVPGLNLEEIIELTNVAREKGITMDQLTGKFLREGLDRWRREE